MPSRMDWVSIGRANLFLDKLSTTTADIPSRFITGASFHRCKAVILLLKLFLALVAQLVLEAAAHDRRHRHTQTSRDHFQGSFGYLDINTEMLLVDLDCLLLMLRMLGLKECLASSPSVTNPSYPLFLQAWF
ncbi:hypothetical protein KEM48_007589 [Puccinia striiformis f. sp. tritici PST-130]|nr:hypothetical protein KEM48_007589 [Puccinia striiformis f. sp. tritici PST-130]